MSGYISNLNSTYTTPFINNRPPEIVDSGFYMDIRFDVDDSAPNYIGLHTTLNAPTSDSFWKIYKFTYSGSNVTRIQSQTGVYDNRATLSW